MIAPDQPFLDLFGSSCLFDFRWAQHHTVSRREKDQRMPAGVLRARMNNPIKYRATMPERRSKTFGNNVGRYIVDMLTNP